MIQDGSLADKQVDEVAREAATFCHEAIYDAHRGNSSHPLDRLLATISGALGARDELRRAGVVPAVEALAGAERSTSLSASR